VAVQAVMPGGTKFFRRTGAVSDRGHLGDVLIDGEDVLADGVNVAARLAGIAEPREIYASASA